MDITRLEMPIGPKKKDNEITSHAVVKSTNAIQNCAKTTSIVLDMAV